MLAERGATVQERPADAATPATSSATTTASTAASTTSTSSPSKGSGGGGGGGGGGDDGPQAPPLLARVLFHYKAEVAEELTIEANETVVVLDQDQSKSSQGWWYGHVIGKESLRGYFP